MQILAPGPVARAASSDASTLPSARGLAPEADAAIGASPSLDPFRGAASFEIPLRAPLGTGGMTPSLALRYSSQARGDSWVGFGWSLGLPAITRSLEAGTPAWDDAIDSFEFAGQRLVPESTNPALPRRYRTERESHLRIEHHAGGFWTATTPGGVVLRFGVDAAQARITNPDGRVFQWLLDQQEDPNGNAFVVAYDRRDPGTAYPSVIRYTLRRPAGGGALQSLDGDAAKDRRIEFALEQAPRSDVTESHRAGFPVRIAHRLDHVTVRVAGSIVRRYDLRYAQSADTRRSLLAAVAEYGSDAASAAPQPPFVTTFKYHSNAVLGRLGWVRDSGWYFPPFPLVDLDRRDRGVRLVDVDGDARPDLVKALATMSGDDPATASFALTPDSGVYRNTGAGFESAPSAAWHFPDVPLQAGAIPFSLAWVRGGVSHTTGLDVIDASGDGLADLVGVVRHLDPNSGERSGHGMPSWYLGRPGGGFEPAADLGDLLDDGGWGLNRSGLLDLSYLQLTSGTTSGNARFVDLDGDGRPELVVRGLEDRLAAIGGPEPYQFSAPQCVDARRANYYYENRGGLRFERTSVVDTAIGDCAGFQRTALDFQHCNVGDFFQCGIAVFFNQAYPMRFAGDPYVGTLPWHWFVNRELGVLDLDVNGDGLADTLAATDGSPIGFPSPSGLFLNDGRRGYALRNEWSLPAGLRLYELGTYRSTDTGVRLADVDGDGLPDVLHARGTQQPRIWLNAGGGAGPAGAWVETAAWALPDGIAFVDADGGDTGVRLVDVDGDGMTDIVRSIGDESEVYRNQGAIPDLLIAAATPLGGTTQWSYAPSTAAVPPAVDVAPIPFVVPLVASVTTDATPGAGSQAHTTTYAYEGGSWDADRRELRGFARVVETRPDAARVVRDYATDAARQGRLLAERIEDASGAAWLAYDYEYTPQPLAPPWSPRLARVRRHEYDAQPGAPRTTLTAYHYDASSDAHGAPAAVVEYGAVGAGDVDLVPEDTRTTEFEFVANVATHLVDRPKLRRLRHGATPGSGATLRETRFYYDGDTTGTAPPSRGLLTRRVEGLGAADRPDPTVTWTHDAYGNAVTETDARANAGEGGGTTTTSWDATFHTFPVAVVNALGHRTEYDHATAAGCGVAQSAGAGLVGTERGPNELVAGTSWRRCYDVFGRSVEERAPGDLARTTWSRDDALPDVSVTVARRASQSGDRSETTRLDGFGRAVAIERDGPHGRTVFETVAYDALGRVAAERAPSFDGPHAHETRHAYDPLGRLVATTLPGTGRVHVRAHAHGVVTHTGPTGSIRRVHHDVFGRVARVEEVAESETYVTRYEHDGNDQLVRIVDHHGNATAIEYDRVGRRVRMTDPDVGERRFTYFADGSVASESVGAFETILWDYDKLGRVTGRSGLSQRWPSAWATWRWDTAANGIGRLARSAEDNLHTHQVREYDALGRATRETHVVAAGNRDVQLEFENAWDALGQPQTRRHPTGTVVTWQRDARGFLTAVDAGAAAPDASALEWTADGTLAAWTSPGGVETRADFDATTRLLRGITVDGPEAGRLADTAYLYDLADRVRTRVDYLGADTEDYGYDLVGRLRSVRRVEGGVWVQRTNHYDAIGNLLCRDATGAACGGGVAYAYPYVPADPQRRATNHQATSIGTLAVAHHPGGTLGQLGARRFLYDAFGRLAEVQDGGVPRLRARYDGAGRSQQIWTSDSNENRWLPADDFEWTQTSKRASVHVAIDGQRIATHTLPLDPPSQPRCAGVVPARGAPIDPFDLLGLLAPGFVAYALLLAGRGWRRLPAPVRARAAVATGTGTAFFVATVAPLPWGGRDVARAQGGGPASVYYHRDHLGSVVVATDAAGAAIAARVAYRAWGATETGAAPPTAFGHQGMRHTAGLYDYGARWYDPSIARFVQPDPVIADPYDPQGLGRYAYVRNDPIGRIDPTGAVAFRFDAWAGQIDAYGFTGISIGFGYAGGSWSARGGVSVRGLQIASAQITHFAQAIRDIAQVGAFQFFNAIGVSTANAAGGAVQTTPNFLTGPGLRHPDGVGSARDAKILAGLHPFVANLGAAHLELMETFGLNAFLIEGFRDYAQQEEKHAQGRTTPGRIVSHARAGESFHNFGLAYDIGIRDQLGRYEKDGSDPRYGTAGFSGELIGLEWGGRWRGRRFDPSHFQYRGGRSLHEVRSLFERGKDPLYGY
jgi:RHS repeat-associated protein